MTDPYRPRVARSAPDLVATGEVRSQVDDVVVRLTKLGATPAEVQAVVDHWDDLDPDGTPDGWTRARRAEFVAASDDELRADLTAARAEYEAGHVTEADAAEQARVAQLEAAIADAQGRIGANVATVLAWVGDDPVRAEAVLRLELAPEGAHRRTLVGPAAQVARVDAATIEAAYRPPGGPQASTGPSTPAGPGQASTGAPSPESGEA